MNGSIDITATITILICCYLPALASEQATLTRYNIHQSHIFHVEANTVVNSVLSKIPSHACQPLLDIDVSCTKLDDDAAVTLVEGILNTHDETTETVVNLKLEMNRITPSGVSRVFDLLVGESEEKLMLSEEKEDESVEDDSNITDTASLEAKDNVINATIIDDKIETEIIDTAAQEEIATPPSNTKSTIQIGTLDLSYNDIGGEGTNPPNAQLLNSVRKLFENRDHSIMPSVFLMENCGIGAAFCRNIGRGILTAHERNRIQSNNVLNGRPSILRIGGNPSIGDAGAVALAASFRMAKSSDNSFKSSAIIEELDLSSCNIGDIGAEAIALALASNPSCLKRLDLSNNKISDSGAIALGRALIESKEQTSSFALEKIILDNNALIGDDGAAALAKALSSGAVCNVQLRSCSIRADGATEFGKALVELVKRQPQLSRIEIDISGNPFGISKPKKKKGAAYSASLLRDKASSNIKFISKSLQSRIKGAGFGMGLTTAESDDDEEDMGNVMGDILSDDEDVEEFDSDRLKAVSRCGARLFSSEILNAVSDDSKSSRAKKLQIFIGMRQCLLDDGAIDALAAAKVHARKANAIVAIDTAMNTCTDSALTSALKGEEDEDNELLSSSSERHTNEMMRIAEAEERREAAAEVAAARVQDTFLEDDLFDEYDDYDEY